MSLRPACVLCKSVQQKTDLNRDAKVMSCEVAPLPTIHTPSSRNGANALPAARCVCLAHVSGCLQTENNTPWRRALSSATFRQQAHQRQGICTAHQGEQPGTQKHHDTIHTCFSGRNTACSKRLFVSSTHFRPAWFNSFAACRSEQSRGTEASAHPLCDF